jgi:hypothetical protein
MRTRHTELLLDLAAIAGALLVSAGAWVLARPAGLITLGLFLITAAFLGAWAQGQRQAGRRQMAASPRLHVLADKGSLVDDEDDEDAA